MATAIQLSFFKTAWDEEVAREKQIRESAKTYLTLITAYSAFLIFVRDKLHPSIMASWVYYVAVLTLCVGFALCIWVTKSADYEQLLDPIQMEKDLDDGITDDGDFIDKRIADYSYATIENDKVNSRKAEALSWAGYALLAGIVLHAAFFIGSGGVGGYEFGQGKAQEAGKILKD